MDLEDQALHSFEQSFELRNKSNISNEQGDFLDVYAKIGNIFDHQGRYDESLANFNEYIIRRQIGTGTASDETEIVIQNGDILRKMAVIYNMKGSHDEAIELKALEIYKTNLGEMDIRVANSLHNAGCFFSVAEKCKESLENFEEEYRLRMIILGRNHEDVATTLYNAASSHNMIGNHAKALKCQKEALEIRQYTLGEHHEKATATLQRIACVCREMGDIAAAIITYEEILPALVEEIGSKDLRVASVLYALGNLEDDQGDYESAMRNVLDAVIVKRKWPHA